MGKRSAQISVLPVNVESLARELVNVETLAPPRNIVMTPNNMIITSPKSTGTDVMEILIFVSQASRAKHMNASINAVTAVAEYAWIVGPISRRIEMRRMNISDHISKRVWLCRRFFCLVYNFQTRKKTEIIHKRPNPFFCMVTPIHIISPDHLPYSTPKAGKYFIRRSEKGIRIKTDLLITDNTALRGFCSETTTAAMVMAMISLVHRLIDIKPISDQKVLISI
jgi:hypothetical protein